MWAGIDSRNDHPAPCAHGRGTLPVLLSAEWTVSTLSLPPRRRRVNDEPNLDSLKKHARLTRLPAMRLLNNMATVRGDHETAALKTTAGGCGYSNSTSSIYCKIGDRNARRCDRFESTARDGRRSGSGVLL